VRPPTRIEMANTRVKPVLPFLKLKDNV